MKVGTQKNQASEACGPNPGERFLRLVRIGGVRLIVGASICGIIVFFAAIFIMAAFGGSWLDRAGSDLVHNCQTTILCVAFALGLSLLLIWMGTASKSAWLFTASCASGIVLVVGFLVFGISSDIRNHRQANISTRILAEIDEPLMEECKALGDKPFWIDGGCLLAGELGDRVATQIPRSMIARPSDRHITVFVISMAPAEKMFDYQYGEKPGGAAASLSAYRQKADVYVFEWPDRRPVAAHRIVGGDPPKEITISLLNVDKLDRLREQGGAYGDIAGPVAQWIVDHQRTR